MMHSKMSKIQENVKDLTSKRVSELNRRACYQHLKVDQMRNDAISGKSKMSRKEIESVALQLMNVASKITDLKVKYPSLFEIN